MKKPKRAKKIYRGQKGTCLMCDAKNVECCIDGNCRRCHVSLTWEECLDGTWSARQRVRAGA